MSIADKLTYLDTTKQLLKTEINKINNVLDDNSTFRSYPQELFNGYIDILNNGTDTLWSNLEKVSASGEEATLENVETAPIKMVLNGNTSQETTSGKNILPSVNLEEKTIDGVTFTPVYKNGLLEYININGTKESQQNVGYTISNVNFENGEEYTISGVIGFTSATLQLFTNSSEAFPLGYRLRSTNGKETKTAQADEICSVSLYVYYGNTYDNVKVYPMICKNNTNDTYEPYTGGQPSPSPDYPQQVKVVKGENVVSVSGKNLLPVINVNGTYSNVQATTNEDGSITLNGTASSNYAINIITNWSLSLKNGKTYTLSGCPNYNDKDYLSLELYSNSPSNQYLTDIGQGKTFTLTSDRTYRCYIAIKGGKTYDNVTFYPMVEEGSTATPYVPYSKTDYPIDLIAKNIFDKDNANILNAWINTSTKVITGSNSNRTIWVEVKSNTTYKVKKIADTSSNGRFRVGSSPNPPVVGGTLAQAIQDDTAEEITITTGANDKYIAVFCYSTSSSISLDDILASLEIKEANAVYEEMCKIGDYKDYIHKSGTDWFVHRAIGKVVLDGSESWARSDISGSSEYFRFRTSALQNLVLVPSSSGVLMNAYCDLFVIQTANDTYKRIEGISAISNGKMDIYYEPLKEYTASEFKTWLSNNNVTLYYILATPTETEITNTTLIEQLEAISKAKSVKDKTYITQTNEELPFVLDVEAIKEYNVE